MLRELKSVLEEVYMGRIEKKGHGEAVLEMEANDINKKSPIRHRQSQGYQVSRVHRDR